MFTHESVLQTSNAEPTRLRASTGQVIGHTHPMTRNPALQMDLCV
jgi:hypothetical protein